MNRRPSYLVIIASSCQMYSGTGTAIFDWMRYAKDDFEFSILMDTENELNYRITKDFAEGQDIKLYPSRALALPGCIDTGVRAVGQHLQSHHYDYIECLSWANGSTNFYVLASKGERTKLIFTPHSQPMWTLPDHERYFMTPKIFSDTLRAADFVFIDSSEESKLPEFQGMDMRHVHSVPLGVDTDLYKPGTKSTDAKQILCICDCRETRKGVGALLAAFKLAYEHDHSLRLVLGGKGSDTLDIPAEIRHAVTGLGYVDQSALVGLYQQSALFVLLTNYEAFGLPIAEALCCGCPVLLNELDVLVAIFSGLPGVSFTSSKDLPKTAEMMCSLVSEGADRTLVAATSASKFSFDATYGMKRSILLCNHHVN